MKFKKSSTTTQLPSNKSFSLHPVNVASNSVIDEAHRINSLYNELTMFSPQSVEDCNKNQFLMRLFGEEAKSVLVTHDPNSMQLEDANNVFGIDDYFLPILPPVDGGALRSGRSDMINALKFGRYKFAAFEVYAEETPEQFIKEIKSGAYPCAAIISIRPCTVHMVCRVDAASVEHYQDCCGAILAVANDTRYCNRAAKQVTFCSMPNAEIGNLIYMNGEVRWHLPIIDREVPYRID